MTHFEANVAQKVQTFKELSKTAGIEVTFSDGFRTNADQKTSYEAPNLITPASPGTSLHEAGRAFDMQLNKLKDDATRQIVIDNAKKAGFGWGGGV